MRRPFFALTLLLAACAQSPAPISVPSPTQPYVLVLGIAQDGGYPQAGCRRPDCVAAFRDPSRRRLVASLAIVDPTSHQRWMIDATPDFPAELARLDREAPVDATPGLDGILLTHAHIGHYTGLMHLGREVMGTRDVPVWAMRRMRMFLESNGPWDQLVRLHNIAIRPLEEGNAVALDERITVTPLVVPHRDEYSETVGFVIRGPQRSILWLPDIDKWERWSTPLETVLEQVDVAFVDGTFYDESELPGRDLRDIPHPTMQETMSRLATRPELAHKVRFVHLNQSNPVIHDDSRVRSRGFAVAFEGEREGL